MVPACETPTHTAAVGRAEPSREKLDDCWLRSGGTSAAGEEVEGEKAVDHQAAAREQVIRDWS